MLTGSSFLALVNSELGDMKTNLLSQFSREPISNQTHTYKTNKYKDTELFANEVSSAPSCMCYGIQAVIFKATTKLGFGTWN